MNLLFVLPDVVPSKTGKYMQLPGRDAPISGALSVSPIMPILAQQQLSSSSSSEQAERARRLSLRATNNNHLHAKGVLNCRQPPSYTSSPSHGRPAGGVGAQGAVTGESLSQVPLPRLPRLGVGAVYVGLAWP